MRGPVRQLTTAAAAPPGSDGTGLRQPITLAQAAAQTEEAVLDALGTGERGLSSVAAAQRRAEYGPNSVATHGASALTVLWSQLRSPLLGLLAAAAAVSFFVGERSDALIIAVIVTLSTGLGFVNEYRAARQAAALHDTIAHHATVVRDGHSLQVNVLDLVPGDIVELRLGDIVPADLRLLESNGCECDESVLTGESETVEKNPAPVAVGAALADRTCCAFMGTVVHAGAARAVVVATGAATEFGAIAAGLSTHPLETSFQQGLRRFSMLLVWVAAVLTSSIFVINIVLSRPVLDALLFSLAIAVGITPQLLPAVVATSLASGSRVLARKKVLVKRLVCIEDLGDVDVLFTDKTGTLTEGQITYLNALAVGDHASGDVLAAGVRACDVTVGEGTFAGNSLDVALWSAPAATKLTDDPGWHRVASLPFDHERRMNSVLVEEAGVRTMIVKGAPEAVLQRCSSVSGDAQSLLDAQFAAGYRVVAVAQRRFAGDVLTVDDERNLILVGFLIFLDPPKADAAASLARLSQLGVSVKVVTGDNAAVAATVCRELGLPVDSVLSGGDLDGIDDAELGARLAVTSVFARVSPEQKARIVTLERRTATAVAFLGDGVNDALALHAADVGISVDSATDVAKDAADVILLEKDLNVLADGVAEGRRIFANTVKYVLMGTSSNFGNMFSAAGASLFLKFLPMLPSQILLNNLLYDTGQLAIPTDHVDEEQLRRPSHWDLAFIRRFMLVFGPISSVFDFATFAVMLWVLHAGVTEFRTGWFVESLATQTLVVFVIRTRRVPFVRSRASRTLTVAALTTLACAIALPLTPLAGDLGFTPLPLVFFVVVAVMVVIYLALIDAAKHVFFRASVNQPRDRTGPPVPAKTPDQAVGHRHRRRRAAYFAHWQRP